MTHTWIHYLRRLLKCIISRHLMPHSDVVVIVSMQPYWRMTWALVFFVLNRGWSSKDLGIQGLWWWCLTYSEQGSCHIHVNKVHVWGYNASLAQWLQDGRERCPISWMGSYNIVYLKDMNKNKHHILIPHKNSEDHASGDPVHLKVHLFRPFGEHSTHAASYSSPPVPRPFLEPSFLTRYSRCFLFLSSLLSCFSLQAVDMEVSYLLFMALYIIFHCNMCICLYLEYVCMFLTSLSEIRPFFGVPIFLCKTDK
jgi:hypothetical protein